MIPLPNIAELKRITKSLATLDLMICPEWEERYYSFDSNWSETEEMASMRNGCGDDWFILFGASGFAGIKGLAHESPAVRDADRVRRIRAALPREFDGFANEPAFHWESTGFCYWCPAGDDSWHEEPEQANTETGAEVLLSVLSDPCAGYLQFASDYYEIEIEVDRSLVEHILAHHPVTPEIVEALNPEIGLEDIQEALEQVGYPNENE
jgi:hypothetical protein